MVAMPGRNAVRISTSGSATILTGPIGDFVAQGCNQGIAASRFETGGVRLDDHTAAQGHGVIGVTRISFSSIGTQVSSPLM